jgi:hypothetical protein
MTAARAVSARRASGPARPAAGRRAKHVRNIPAGRFTVRKHPVTAAETLPGDAGAQRRVPERWVA